MIRRLLLLSGLIVPLGGCAWAVRETTDQTVRDLVAHPFDVAPEPASRSARASAEAPEATSNPSAARSDGKTGLEVRSRAALTAGGAARPQPDEKPPGSPGAAVDVLATAMLGSPRDRTPRDGRPPADPVRCGVVIPLLEPAMDLSKPRPKSDRLLLASWSPEQQGSSGATAPRRRLDPQIPPQLPGSEAPRITLPRGAAESDQAIARLYPELSSLPVEPRVMPGPEGRPYTLADFQRLAAANSPTLRQAASDVEAARGALIQAKTYPNPVVTYLVNPSNNNSTAGVQGGAIDQPIITGGKMKLGVAAAQKNLDNAILALKRARMDLATSVRNAYFTLLVDVETLVVTRALAQFSDDIYRLQVGLQKGTQVAPYEPAGLRAQTFANRLAYMQAIQSYMYDWKSLVATLGLPQLPLSEIAGQVDRFVPYYDFDEVRAHVLQHHTDVLTARNGVKIAQYGLKLAQVTGVIPDLDVYASLEKDFALAPFGMYQTLGLGFPLPIWNRNKGNIITAQAALIRATEETHRVEVALTNNLASAYGNYRNNLYAMDYYRRNILPDLVRYYRGVYERRQIDPGSAFGDLVFAQQNLATNVNTYIGILGSLWSSVVGVADYLQTDDLYQMARPREVPALPDLGVVPPHWSCGHDSVAASCGPGAGVPLAAGASPPGPMGAAPVIAASPPASPPVVAGTANPRPAGRTAPAPAPPTDPEIGPATWMERWRARLTAPMALMRVDSGEQPDPTPPAGSGSGEEKNHDGWESQPDGYGSSGRDA